MLNDTGMSSLNIAGYVQDADNNDITLSAEIANVLYKKITVPSAGSTKAFSIPIDMLADAIPPGDYTLLVKAVDPSNASASASMSFRVRQRLKRNMFVLINSPITSNTTYTDYEGDTKYAERYKYQHDPNLFDNSMGMIADSGSWRSAPYESFPFTGNYIATYQPRDNPKLDNRFDEYRMWGRDNISQLSFQVHRKPVALFAAKSVGGVLQVTDSSYDQDHITRIDKGLREWQWQYRKGDAQLWTDGLPAGSLSATDVYQFRLRVRDIDGENAIGVWSDWCVRSVGSAAGNLPPVAMFTVEPGNISYRKATTITDKSFDPDNDPLDTYQWTVVKNSSQTVWSYSGNKRVPPNIAGYGTGSYTVTLKVRDNRALWSEAYSQNVTVMNHPPVAIFNMPMEVYRDTVIEPENLSPNPDEDGDNLIYSWKTANRGGTAYTVSTARSPGLSIQSVIDAYSLVPKQAVSDHWEMKLSVSDGSLSSVATQTFSVLNHTPVAEIEGPAAAYQFDTGTFNSLSGDEDTADQSSLRYYWQVTDSGGLMKSYSSKAIRLSFPESGIYHIEHWVIDQIGAKSNVAVLDIKVAANQAPAMAITAPAGTLAAPTVIDAQMEGDPLIKWTYTDPEGDPQEKYQLQFFLTKSDLLAKTIENADPGGILRQYQVPNLTFERFEYYYLFGRAYSKGSWSEASNQRAFIIDNPPQPGFTLFTDNGRNAAAGPIYRTDVLNIGGTATDADIPQGDSISYRYYLKPAGGSEGLASGQASFGKQFTSNGVFVLRQVVTDSLGLTRELSHNITVANRLPTVSLTYPVSDTPTVPSVINTLTPVIKWDYQDADNDEQQQFKVRIIRLSDGSIKAQSGEQISGAKQWNIPAGLLQENEIYAAEVEVYDGYSWGVVSPRKYFMVNLLTVRGAVQHTAEWNENRQAFNVKASGNPESPRGYTVFWAGERFVLQANTTGLPDTVVVTMSGGYTTSLSPANSGRTVWTGELYHPAFEQLPEGPLSFIFTASNSYNTKTDTVTVTILGDWSQYFRSHRIK
ncbi:hypothetical protein [Paenibacillus tepidiphilus]|uniref:hypothetical protein n=1 Tax=Paenibacillus tepidiphilus TaxID=2608683 RepID=UPI00123885DB|nr:hypothetical protein [Paenibacillus tepidiphilus]